MALGHIRSPDHLLSFFREKGWNHLVLDLVDVKGIDPQLQITLAEFFVGCQDPWSREQREVQLAKLRADGPMAYLGRRVEEALVVIPYATLCDGRYTVQELAALQQIVEEYKDHRRGQGRPTRESTCDCGGKAGCRACGGTGRIVTLVEMSDRETEIARHGR
jgi:hypothetical protein